MVDAAYFAQFLCFVNRCRCRCRCLLFRPLAPQQLHFVSQKGFLCFPTAFVCRLARIHTHAGGKYAGEFVFCIPISCRTARYLRLCVKYVTEWTIWEISYFYGAIKCCH